LGEGVAGTGWPGQCGPRSGHGQRRHPAGHHPWWDLQGGRWPSREGSAHPPVVGSREAAPFCTTPRPC